MKTFVQKLAKYYVLSPMEAFQRSRRYVENRELIHAAMGLAGESGEVLDLIKKSVNYGSPLNDDKFLEECGDTVHYLARVLEQRGFTIADAQTANLKKLALRFPEGYSDTAAIDRKDQG